MRSVLIGTDFMYNQNGDLIPIEINTNVGFDIRNRLEPIQEIYNFTDLITFIKTNGMTHVDYIGKLSPMSNELSKALALENITYTAHLEQAGGDQTIYVDDADYKLIIRSTYDSLSILDSEYCADKENFMDLIHNETFGSEYSYLNSQNEYVSTITSIFDNGDHPNFILKYTYPSYDKAQYPKLYKLSNLSEIRAILEQFPFGYFMMPFYFNEDKLFFNHIKFIRNHSILHLPTLEAINVGQYTKICGSELPLTPQYNTSGELFPEFRSSYLPLLPEQRRESLLEDSDIVKMADGTFKTGLDLQIGDVLKSIKIPNPYGIDILNNTTNYHIDLDTFLSGTTFSESSVVIKSRINEVSNIYKLTFSDDTIWYDTEMSSYLVYFNNEVRFMRIKDIPINTTVLMVDTSNMGNVQFIEKTITSKVVERILIQGWQVLLDNDHIFLTGDEQNTGANFLAIEHNVHDMEAGNICYAEGYECSNISMVIECDKGFICTGYGGSGYCTEAGGYVALTVCEAG